MTGHILAYEVDHLPDDVESLGKSGRGVVPFSPACLTKLARDNVRAQIDRRSGVAAITAALHCHKLRATRLRPRPAKANSPSNPKSASRFRPASASPACARSCSVE